MGLANDAANLEMGPGNDAARLRTAYVRQDQRKYKECYMLRELISRKGARGGMQRGTITKYQPFPPIDLPDLQWPSRTITSAPIWCSVDLRDVNQALPIPKGIKKNLEMFHLLVETGIKEYE